MRTRSVVGSQAINPTISGFMEHKPIVKFHNRNQVKNQKQYFALKLSFNVKRKSLHTLLRSVAPFTLSTLKASGEGSQGKDYGVILILTIFRQKSHNEHARCGPEGYGSNHYCWADPEVAKTPVKGSRKPEELLRRIERRKYTTPLGETKIYILKIVPRKESYGYEVWKLLKEEFGARVKIPRM